MIRKLITLPIVVSLFVTGLFTFVSIDDIRALDVSARAIERTEVVSVKKPKMIKMVEHATEHKEHKPLTLENMKKLENKVQKEKQARESLVKKSDKNKPVIEQKIRNASIKHGIDPDIAVAISRLETGHWKSNVFKKYNNVGGMMHKGKPIQFNSIDDGVNKYVKNLKKGYFDQGLDTPVKMQKKYCPPDNQWDNKVERIMRM